MTKAEEYRSRAAKCLAEAEIAPTHLRLQLLTIAQKRRELAEQVEKAEQDGDESGPVEDNSEAGPSAGWTTKRSE